MTRKFHNLGSRASQVGGTVALIALLTQHGLHASEADAASVYASVRQSVVSISSSNHSVPMKTGSGVIVAKNSVLSNCHVIDGATEFSVRFSNGEVAAGYPGERVSGIDLCTLVVSTGRRSVATVAPVKSVQVGQKVFAIGDPLALSASLSDGLVAGIRAQGGRVVIQTTAAISPGSSGGGLFDASGHLVGITTFSLMNGQNLNFALPAEYLNSTESSPIENRLSSSEPLTFKGVPFGASIQSFQTSFPGTVCREQQGLAGVPHVVCRGGPIDYLGRMGGYDAYFAHEALESVEFQWGIVGNDNPRDLAKQMEARIGKYFGVPSVERWDREGVNATWSLSPDQSIILGYCGKANPPFCQMPAATLTLADRRFSAEAAPSKDF